MRTLAVRSVRANPARFVATALAVVVGTGFLAGALVLRDSVGASLEASMSRQLQGVDAAILNDQGLEVARGVGGAAPGTTPGSVPGDAAGPPPGTPPATDAGGGPPPESRRGSGIQVEGGARGSHQLGIDQNVPASVLDAVRPVPQVAAAAGVLRGFVSVLDDSGGTIVSNATGSLWLAPDQLNPYRIVGDGHAPTGPGEVVVDARTAENGGLHVGDRLHLATSLGPRDATLVGIARYGEQQSSGRNDVLVSDADGFEWFASGRREYNAIYAVAAPGVTPEALVAALRPVAGDTLTVETGDELRATSDTGLGDAVNIIGTALIGFAFVSLFVALFTIYNTFSIVVQQRTREFALLRALGAGTVQIKRSVRTEAALVGLASSAAGVVLGVVFVNVLMRLVPQVEDIVGAVIVRVSVVVVLLVLAVGTTVTVLSAIVPAWRAARSRPLEALRDVAVDRSATSRPRAVVGLFLLGLGVALLLIGALVSSPWPMAAGPPLLFLGVIVGGPVLAGVFGQALRVVLGPLRRTTLKVGVENVQRNPRRSSTTALALVIGVFLVVLVTAGGGAVRDYAVAQLSQFAGPDVTVVTFGGELPRDMAEKVRGLDGVDRVAETYLAVAFTDDGFPVSAVDFGDIGALGLSFEAGDADHLGQDDVILPSFIAQSRALHVGDPLRVQFGNGETRDLRVGAVSKPAFPVSAYLPAETARAADPAIVPVALQVTARGGEIQRTIDGVTALSRTYAGVDVQPGNLFAQVVKGFFNFVIAAANGLLTVAVVIALFGIVNTLALSVSERRHEIGLLRALGMTRRQVRATIRLEAVAVSLLGALVGTAFGLFVAWCLTRPILSQEGEVTTGFSWPLGHLLVILILSLLVGAMASLVPARRAARLNIIDAVASE